MSREERVRFLLRIAQRVEGEGDERAASLFRRMAEEARPLELEALVRPFVDPVELCTE